MKRLALLVLAVSILVCSLPVQAAVVEEKAEYTAAGQTLRGYLLYDDAAAGKRPGIVVVHEWWGLNDYARKRARMLAELGYTALAVDMYGDGKTASHPDEAGRFATEVRQHMDVGRQRFLAGLELLRRHPTVDPKRIGAIGYCFGGSIVLQMARDGVDLDGVASFHGPLTTENPAVRGKVKGRVMVANGGADTFIPMEQIQAFIAEMVAAGVTLQFHSYPGALHSFTNPGADELAAKFDLHIGYNKQADKLSWQTMRDFFQQLFQEE